MSALPCSSFIPMAFDKMVFCSSCGYSSDFHLTDPVDQVTQFDQLNPDGDVLPVFPPQIDQQRDLLLPPAPAIAPATLNDGNVVVSNSSNSISNQLLPDETVKYRVFSSQQVKLMVHKACSLKWNLKGLSQDADIDQFCKEIGVARVQFNKWVYRSRKRLGWRRG